MPLRLETMENFWGKDLPPEPDVYHESYVFQDVNIGIPVVPHKAVAEVSRIGNV